MPLIGICGVSNIGQKALKSFPVTFAWTSNEQETTYEWVLRMLKKEVGNALNQTVFVTDKCTVLRNTFDKYFPDNKKLLCAWHMLNNLNDHCNKKTFRDDVVVEEFRSCVTNYTKNISRINDIL